MYTSSIPGIFFYYDIVLLWPGYLVADNDIPYVSTFAITMHQVFPTKFAQGEFGAKPAMQYIHSKITLHKIILPLTLVAVHTCMHTVHAEHDE